jgi:hypothetical protein
MSSKRRKGGAGKPRRSAPAKKPQVNEVDVLEGPGFRMERHGRIIHATTDRTLDQQRELNERLAAAVAPMRDDLVEKVRAIEARLAKFDTFTVLAALGLQNHLLDPETYEEHTHKGESVVAEYATLLALKGFYSTGTEIYANGRVLDQLQSDLRNAFRAAIWLQVAVDAGRSIKSGRVSDPSELEKLQFAMRTHELGVRNPAYQHHHHEVLKGLFRPFEAALVASVGFCPDDAIRLADVIPRRMTRRFLERMREAVRALEETQREVQRARKHEPKVSNCTPVSPAGTEDGGYAGSLVRQLAGLAPKKAKQFLKNAAVEWVILAASDICCFTAEELAEEAGVDLERATAYLAAFQIDFGDVSSEFVEFSATHPLRSRPIVRHGSRYLSPAPMLLDWAIQPAFEAALKDAAGSTWERYQKHRHDWLLHTSVRLLERVMPSAEFATNLLYDEGGDRAKEAELDMLVHYDTAVFLVEAKGADVTEPARRGAPERLRRDLERVIKESHAQAVRAKSHLKASSTARFRRVAGGADVVVSAAEVSDIVLMSVLLAPLGHLTSLLHADSELGFFKNGEYSWAVSIYDLMVIAEIIDLPPVFPHYVKRRVHAAHLGVLEAHDELDVFGYYLKEGLYLDDMLAEMRAHSDGRSVSIGLLSYTAPFDAYMFHSIGARKKPAPKPAQRMGPKLRSLLERLECSRLPQRLEAALGVLDLDDESRRDLLRYIEKARRIALRTRRISNVTMQGRQGDGWGLTYVCGFSDHELQQKLREYCDRKRREFGVGAWVGFAERIDRNPKVVAVVVSRRDRNA